MRLPLSQFLVSLVFESFLERRPAVNSLCLVDASVYSGAILCAHQVSLSNFFVWKKLSSCRFWIQHPLCTCLRSLNGQDFDCVDDGCCMLSCCGGICITLFFVHHQHALDVTTQWQCIQKHQRSQFFQRSRQQFFIP